MARFTDEELLACIEHERDCCGGDCHIAISNVSSDTNVPEFKLYQIYDEQNYGIYN